MDLSDADSEPSPDTRGILDPGRFHRTVRYERFDAGPALDGLVGRIWAVVWDLPFGRRHDQEVLNHPCANLSVGHAKSRGVNDESVEFQVVGVPSVRSVRHLSGTGWNVAAMTAVGAFGAFLRTDAVDLADRDVPARGVLDLDAGAVRRALCDAEGDLPAQAAALSAALSGLIERADPARVEAARETAAIAGRAERDRSLRTAAELAAAAGVGLRTLQRMFRTYAGASPAWILRRYRLIDAAEAARNGGGVSWTDLAHDLGYADQAHLTRDFKATLGCTPSAYARRVTPLEPAPDLA